MNGIDELIGVDWFPEIRIRVEVVRFDEIFAGVRTHENNGGDTPQIGIIFDLLEDFVTVLSREIEVEQDESRLRCIRVLSTLVQVVEHFDVIPYNVNGVGDFPSLNASFVSRILPELSSTSRISTGSVVPPRSLSTVTRWW